MNGPKFLKWVGAFALIAFGGLLGMGGLYPQASKQLVLGVLERVWADNPIALKNDEPLATPQIKEALSLSPVLSSKAQSWVVQYLSEKFRIAQEPMLNIVGYAVAAGQKHELDPLLILAVAAVESRFNPYAASPMGATGLMQVVAHLHSDKFSSIHDIKQAVLDPQSNVMVGAQILKDCMVRGGSLDRALKLYLGVGDGSDEGYLAKVYAELSNLRRAVVGKPIVAKKTVAVAPTVISSVDVSAVLEVEPPNVEIVNIHQE
jgi:soluble lytic murein transglycosylase-like protein